MSGKFIISFDTELSWGMFDVSNESFIFNEDFGEKMRYIINKLLGLLKKYKISATWAIVGHLFLDECKKIDGIKHPDLKHPNHPWFPDWYKYDPATNIHQDSSWYGIDIVEMIKSTTPKQDIGCHSFSHCVFNEKGVGKEVIKSEIEKCMKLAQKSDIKLESFVFPRNGVAYTDLLADNEFKIYRDVTITKYDNFNSFIKRIGMVLDDLFALKPICSDIKKENKILKNNGSMLWRSRESWRKLIPLRNRVIRAKKGIDNAIDEDEIFHLWTHPLNFYFETDKMLKSFERVLKYAAQKKDGGKLIIENMSSMAQKYIEEK